MKECVFLAETWLEAPPYARNVAFVIEFTFVTTLLQTCKNVKVSNVTFFAATCHLSGFRICDPIF